MPRWLSTVLLSSAAIAGGFALWHLPLAGAPAPYVAPPVAPTSNDCFALDAAFDRAAVPPEGGVDRMLVVTVTGKDGCGAERMPLDLSLVVDVSGSMRDAQKLEDAQAAALSLLDRLQPEDRVALVSFADGGRIWGTAEATSELPRTWVRGLRPEGGTNLHEGLVEGLGVLTPASHRLRRVLVLTDGQANLGYTRADQLIPILEQRDDVTVSTVGLGPDYNEVLLGALALAGHGTFHHAETRAALVDAYTEELSNARHVAAHGVQLRITPPAGGTVTAMPGGFAAAGDLGLSDAGQIDAGVITSLGDLAAGETRTVVVRVHTASGAADASAGFSDVSAGFADASAGFADASAGFAVEATGTTPGSARPLTASTRASPVVDTNPAAWGLANPALAVPLARAEAAEDLARAREEYASGAEEQAKQRLDRRFQTLKAVEALHPEAADLAPLAASLDEVTTAPTTALKEKRAYASSQRMAH